MKKDILNFDLNVNDEVIVSDKNCSRLEIGKIIGFMDERVKVLLDRHKTLINTDMYYMLYSQDQIINLTNIKNAYPENFL